MMYTGATCYESEMRYPTDAKLLWKGIEKSYATMSELSRRVQAWIGNHGHRCH